VATEQKSGHAPFFMQTVTISYNMTAGKIWGEEDNPDGLGGCSSSVFGLFWHR